MKVEEMYSEGKRNGVCESEREGERAMVRKESNS